MIRCVNRSGLPRNIFIRAGARHARSKAAEIIAGYGDGDERENLVDLLADAMHWCDGFGEPFDEFCGTAGVHFAQEVTGKQEGSMSMKVQPVYARAIAYHRNGIGGAPFHVVLFDEDGSAPSHEPGRKIGIVFESPGTPPSSTSANWPGAMSPSGAIPGGATSTSRLCARPSATMTNKENEYDQPDQ